jgi:hypothetical protein
VGTLIYNRAGKSVAMRVQATLAVADGITEAQLSHSRRMKANVFRVLGKQGTGALIVSSRCPRLRRLLPLLPTILPRHQQHRHFSSTHVPLDEPFQTTFEDPSRKGLFYHLVPPPTPLSDTHPVFAVSLIPDPPPLSESCTVLGWLPAETPGDDREAGLYDFVENRTCAA